MGGFLQIAPAQAEKIVSTMVIEKRITATLDQETRFIEFESDQPQRRLAQYNSQISHLTNDLNDLITEILKVHPKLQKYDVHRV